MKTNPEVDNKSNEKISLAQPRNQNERRQLPEFEETKHDLSKSKCFKKKYRHITWRRSTSTAGRQISESSRSTAFQQGLLVVRGPRSRSSLTRSMLLGSRRQLQDQHGRVSSSWKRRLTKIETNHAMRVATTLAARRPWHHCHHPLEPALRSVHDTAPVFRSSNRIRSVCTPSAKINTSHTPKLEQVPLRRQPNASEHLWYASIKHNNSCRSPVVPELFHRITRKVGDSPSNNARFATTPVSCVRARCMIFVPRPPSPWIRHSSPSCMERRMDPTLHGHADLWLSLCPELAAGPEELNPICGLLLFQMADPRDLGVSLWRGGFVMNSSLQVYRR